VVGHTCVWEYRFCLSTIFRWDIEANLTEWHFLFFLFTPIKFLFNIPRSWWPCQCLNPRQSYQARLLVKERGCHLDRGCKVKIQKTWMWTIVGSVCGCLCASTSFGVCDTFLDIVIISVLLWLTCTRNWLDKRLTWLILLIIAAGLYLLSNIIYW